MSKSQEQIVEELSKSLAEGGVLHVGKKVWEAVQNLPKGHRLLPLVSIKIKKSWMLGDYEILVVPERISL